MGWPVRVFQNLIYLNKKVESDLGTLLTTPKSTQNENIRSNECQSSLLLTYRQCRRRWPAARGGGGTRRWPSPRPRGSCRSAHRRKVTQSSIKLQSSSVKFTCMGVVCPPPAPDHTNSLLSLPPLARYWLSGDHLSPQTSCLCPTSLRSGLIPGVLTSRCRISLSLLPELRVSPA